MTYMLLIVEPVGQRREHGEAEGKKAYAAMLAFSDNLAHRGLLQLSQSLKSQDAGARVQVRNGKRTLIDGPFSEAKEMVGGFYLLNTDDRAQAIAIAAECPAAQWATIEVRELGPCYL
jgi:hypothetical protein